MEGDLGLTVLERVPPRLLDVPPTELHTVLPGPTLLHLAGARERPLFVTTLLHGNETSGFEAVQRLLRKYDGQELPCSLSIFFGNIDAARLGRRRLQDQPDYNRVWPGGSDQRSPEAALMRRVLLAIQSRRPFASIDIHNTTGKNPHYAIVSHLDPPFLHLASLFSRRVVYSIKPTGVQPMAIGELCPAITVECGPASDKAGAQHALEFIETCLGLSDIQGPPSTDPDIDLFHMVAIVKIPELMSFSFGESHADICLRDDLDHLNFTEVPASTPLGRIRPGTVARLDVVDEWGADMADAYLVEIDGEIRTKKAIIPSLFTLDERIVRQDCLGYFMERLALRPSQIPAETR